MLGATGGRKNYMFEPLCGKRDVVDGWMYAKDFGQALFCAYRDTGLDMEFNPFQDGLLPRPTSLGGYEPSQVGIGHGTNIRCTLLRLANYNNSWIANKMTEQYLRRAKHTIEATLRLSFSFSTTLSAVLLDFSLTTLSKGSHSM